jgi:chemotaxis protein CheD
MPLGEQDFQPIERFQYFLKPGYVFLSPEPSLISTVLGSAVTVCLWDRKHRYGGVAHFLYPEIKPPNKTTTQYGNVAILTLIKLLINDGSEKTSLEAQVFGGGDPNSYNSETLGNQNILIAKKILTQQGILITSEDVGGSRGRKLVFKTDTNEAVVLKVDRLRQEDWFPYGIGRSG